MARAAFSLSLARRRPLTLYEQPFSNKFLYFRPGKEIFLPAGGATVANKCSQTAPKIIYLT